MTKAQQEIFNRGLSPSNNHHHGSAYRYEKLIEKRRLKKQNKINKTGEPKTQ